MRCNPDLKAKYQALRAAGKTAKVAVTPSLGKPIEMTLVLVGHDRE